MSVRRATVLFGVMAAAGLLLTPSFSAANDGLAPQGEAQPAQQDVIGIDEKIGAQLPLDLKFRDEAEQPVNLRECIAGKPTILVPMYYRCPLLCNLVLQELVKTLREMPQDFSVGGKFNVVAISFDPKEHCDLASGKKNVVIKEYGREGAEQGWHFLTGSKEAIKELMEVIGYRYEFDRSFKEYNHPTGILIVTPEGKIARYFMGMRYAGDFEEKITGGKTTLRLSLIEAADGKGGSLLDNIYLKCYTFDHVRKGYSLNVLRAVQIGGILTLMVVGFFLSLAIWRERRNRESRTIHNLAEALPEPRKTNDGPPSGGTA